MSADSSGPDDLLDRVLSYEAIRQLAHRYAVAIDALDMKQLVSLFVPNVDMGSAGQGRDALRASYERLLDSYPFTIHNVGTQTIEFDDMDHAHGVVYCRAEMQMGEQWVVKTVMYQDRYERQAGMWAFASRSAHLFYGADVLRRPIGLPPASAPEGTTTGRGSAPQCWPTWEQFRNRQR